MSPVVPVQEKFPSGRNVNLHTVYQSDDEDEDLEDEIKTGWKLYEAIFSYLDPESLLEARQVCKRWNNVIVQSVDSLLWTKMCVRIENNENWPKPIFSNAAKTMAVTVASRNHIFSSLSSAAEDLQNNNDPPVVGFSHILNHSPNFHFVKCDFRLDCVHDFFTVHGSFLKFIKITNCTLTLPTLQVILYSCERVEHFEVNGLSRNLVIGESIFPKKFSFRRFPRLKTLILKSPEEPSKSANGHHKMKVHNSYGSEEDELKFENNLTCGFIQDLIDYADNLEKIVLIGWSPKTGSDFMSILTHRGRYSKVKEFHMTCLPPVVKSVHLIPLCVKTAHIRLKKLTISPNSPHQFNDFGNIIIREIIKNYRESLEELNISHCPVGSSIFRFPCPQLRIIIAIGTMIKSPILFRNQTPKLEKFVYRANPSSPKQVFERIRLLLRAKAVTPQYILDRLREKLGSIQMDNVHSQTFAEMMAHGCWTRPCENSDNSNNHNHNDMTESESNASESRSNFMHRSKSTSRQRGKKVKSVLEGFDTCSWIDFACLVFFTSLLILLLIWSISSLFNTFAPIVFVFIIVSLIITEIYGEFFVPDKLQPDN